MGTPIYYIDVEKRKRNTAGAKAPKDISEICRRRGMIKLSMPMFPSDGFIVYQKLWLFFACTLSWIRIERKVQKNSIILYQHPLYGVRIAERFIPFIKKKKNCKFIAVVHDLESLRKGIKGVVNNNQKTSEISDSIILREFDMIICHNGEMKQYLIEQGFEPEKLVELGIFDYLCDEPNNRSVQDRDRSIAIAGNLAEGKCAYIYKIFGENKTENRDLKVHLYGNNFNESYFSQQMIYHGSFEPEELAMHLEGDFGLVWDGISAETCAGNTGEYLKYNNPHKTSLYLAAGMPVVVWEEAAIADFVINNGVGITISSLYELEKTINKITEAEYAAMCDNAKKIGDKLRKGYYFNTAFEKCLGKLQ